MGINHQRQARKRYPSKQPLYRVWEHIRKKAARQGIPLQGQWQRQFATFAEAVGEPPAGEPHRLVLINPERGYVWYNVRWLPVWRARVPEKLEWLTYREQREEALTWARTFGLTLREFQRCRDKGWSMRKIACYGEKCRAEKRQQAQALARAGVARANPKVAAEVS